MPFAAPTGTLMADRSVADAHCDAMQPFAPAPTQEKPSIRTLAVGQLLCQFGDPPGPLYIILSGKLLVYRPNPNRPGENLELAELGTGAVVGEVAPLTGQLRSASVKALEASTLLAVPVSQLSMLAKLQAPLTRVIAHALHERAGLSAPEIAALAGNWGIEVPDIERLLAGDPPPPLSPSEVAPDGTSSLYAKTVMCPVCRTAFSTQIVRLHKYHPSDQESDFHQIYNMRFNPYDYEPWVCPTDLYAGLPADFAPLADEQRELVSAAVEEFVEQDWGGERPIFSGERSLVLREQALQIALVVSRARAALPLRLAAIQHRLAWCARERKDAVAEQYWLSEALAAYSAAHEQGAGDSTKEELRIEYLCGELTLRLGDRTTAHAWFAQALLHPTVKAHPMWQRMLRGQRDLARAPI